MARTDADKQTCCQDEMSFTESCLRRQPKSYWVWNHRRWVLETMPVANWDGEIALLDMMLQLDSRNCKFVILMV